MLSVLFTIFTAFAESPIDILNQMAEQQQWSVNTQEMTLTIDGQNNYIIYKMRTQMTMNDDGLYAHAQFLSPSEVENTQITWIDRTEGEDEMWLFLPALGRVTILKDSNRNRAFMGSDFQFEDFALFTIPQKQVVISETDSQWQIVCTPSSMNTPYNRWVISLSKKTRQPLGVELFVDDILTKKLHFPDRPLINNAPSEMIMHTLVNGSKTTLVIRSMDTVTPIPSTVFTKEYLLRSVHTAPAQGTP